MNRFIERMFILADMPSAISKIMTERRTRRTEIRIETHETTVIRFGAMRSIDLGPVSSDADVVPYALGEEAVTGEPGDRRGSDISPASNEVQKKEQTNE